MNPYDFVPIAEDKQPQRSKPAGHDKFSISDKYKSGLIECTITTLKPIFIPLPMDEDKRERQGLRVPVGRNREVEQRYHEKYIFNTNAVDGNPLIPGSSIKGVIRSVAEAAANSCVTFFEKDRNKNYRRYKYEYSLPDGFYPCTDLDKLCITCRLFGFQSSAGSFQGKVNISDAKARSGYKNIDWITLTELLGPKPHHTAFYAFSRGSNRIAGRKFYLHHKHDAAILQSTRQWHLNSSVKPIEDAVFDFKVSFTNLADDEYALLLYSLFLEDGVCHKIGYGKPTGLGSVKIEPRKLTLFDIENRYKKITAENREEKSGEELRDHLTEQTKIYREDKSANLQALRRIWKWSEDGGAYDILYPTHKDGDWFSKNPNDPISKTP
jgi:CRISPR/Cas system CSM-associated protein Csm3 (group 7 of RAMP superfamily)